MDRPHTTVVLAMTADGKIADVQRSSARFSSLVDKRHLEAQIAQADGVLLGAGTLRAYGTTLRVTSPELLKQRQRQGKPPQPVQIVCSNSAQIDPQLPFFRQAAPRWLLTTISGAAHWHNQPGFDKVLTTPPLTKSPDLAIDWIVAFQHLGAANLLRLAVLGGGELVASLLSVDLIDELWLTICPLLLGGAHAPTPVEGAGFLAEVAPRLELLSVQPVGQEIFLHYRLLRSDNPAAFGQ